MGCWLWLSNRFADMPERFPDKDAALAYSEELIDHMSLGLQNMCAPPSSSLTTLQQTMGLNACMTHAVSFLWSSPLTCAACAGSVCTAMLQLMCARSAGLAPRQR